MNKLIEQVRTLDVEAAEFLQRQYNLYNYAYDFDSVSLYDLMDWEDTPQGYLYWSNIALKLGHE